MDNENSKQKVTKINDNVIEGSKVLICAEVRTIDAIGRIVIPRKYRDMYGLHKFTEIEMVPLEGGLMLRTHNERKELKNDKNREC